MAEDRDINDLRVAVGRGLAARLEAEPRIPQHLLELLRRLEKREQVLKGKPHAAP